MFAVIAAVVAVAVITMMWRVLDAEAHRREQDGEEAPPARPQRRRATPARVIAPDDDPEFLRDLSKQIRKSRDDGQPA